MQLKENLNQENSNEKKLKAKNMKHYRKFYFVWYFDDDEGYGIEVFGEKIAGEGVPGRTKGSLFDSVVNWSFGYGTEARDLRRAWGEYASNKTQENNGIIPQDIGSLKLRFEPQNQRITGELEKIIELLGKRSPVKG